MKKACCRVMKVKPESTILPADWYIKHKKKEKKKKKKKRCTATQNGIFLRTVTVKTMADNIYQRNFPAECLSSYNLNLGFVFPSTTLQPEASNEHQEEVETT